MTRSGLSLVVGLVALLGCTDPVTRPTWTGDVVRSLASLPPTASAIVGCSGGVCTFDGRGSTDDQGVVSYAWRPCASSCLVLNSTALWSMNLSPKTRTWTLTVADADAQADTLTFTFTSPDGPGWPPPLSGTVQKLTAGGCSNTERVFRGLARIGGFPQATAGFKKDSLPGGTLSRYLREDPEKWPPNDRWMRGAQSFPRGDAYWFQVCVFVNEPDSTELRRAIEVADSLVLYRPEARIVWSGLGVDANGSCLWAGFVRSEWLADSLVARGYGERGPSPALLAADFEADGCHPDPSGQDKWARALQTHFQASP